MSAPLHPRAALAGLAAILGITASWWALALWPAGDQGPAWLLRTREVCFGAAPDALPNAGGWVLLIGQPLGMAGVLVAVWGRDLREGLARLMAGVTGQLAVGVVAAGIAAGLWSVGERVRAASVDAFETGASDVAARLTRVNDAAPALALTDQAGQEVTLESLRGRPVIVAFAYAHCETVCPAVVKDVLAAQRQSAARSPAVLLVTLDPWRDTPGRLPALAAQWGLGQDARVLSGAPELVERTLNAWRVPRVRNGRTGDISHPSIVYVVDSGGRIRYVLTGHAETIAAAVDAL